MMQNSVIVTDKGISGGTPTFHGTRIPISISFDYLEDNRMEKFLENYPSVSREQISEVLKAAAEISDNEKIINKNFNQ